MVYIICDGYRFGAVRQHAEFHFISNKNGCPKNNNARVYFFLDAFVAIKFGIHAATICWFGPFYFSYFMKCALQGKQQAHARTKESGL